MNNAAKTSESLNKPDAKRVKRAYVIDTLKKYSIEFKEAESDAELAKKLYDYFAASVTDVEQEALQCDVCHGDSPKDLDCCPYCGEGDEKKPTTSEVFVPASPKEEPKMETVTTEVKEKKVKAKVKEEKVEAPKTAKKAKGEEAIVKAVNGTAPLATKLTEKDLDTAVAQLRHAMSDAVGSYWKLGHQILDLYSKDLWKLRCGEDGKAKYTSFEQFTKAELGMEKTAAYNLMDVAKNYSEDKVRQLGHAKLALLLKAPADDRPTIEAKIVEGASYRETKKLVAEAREQKGVKSTDTGRKKMPTGSTPQERAPRPSKKDMITIAALQGTKQVKLYCKENPEKAAKTVADMPWGTLELENDVTMTFSIVKNQLGELVIKIRTKREE